MLQLFVTKQDKLVIASPSPGSRQTPDLKVLDFNLTGDSVYLGFAADSYYQINLKLILEKKVSYISINHTKKVDDILPGLLFLSCRVNQYGCLLNISSQIAHSHLHTKDPCQPFWTTIMNACFYTRAANIILSSHLITSAVLSEMKADFYSMALHSSSHLFASVALHY